MEITLRILCLLVGYLLGSFLTAECIARRLTGRSARDLGSGNPGMANIMATLGKGPGFAVLAGDVAKTVLACGLCWLLAELVNLSVNQSFSRSLMTSITTCLALGVVCVVSVIYRLDSIYTFAFPLLFGMVSGVYSTICIATPLWVDWKSKKKAAKKEA